MADQGDERGGGTAGEKLRACAKQRGNDCIAQNPGALKPIPLPIGP